MALNITQQQLSTARSYADAGDYKGGWKYLASVGDNYADNAYVVTSGNSRDVYDEVMNRMVKNYWDKVAGPDAYRDKFDAVAEQHFRQYVRDIGTNGGGLPDSKQIERSYRDAVIENKLPKETAIDGSITKGIGDILDKVWPGPKNEGLDWTDGLGMEDERQVPSDVFDDIDPAQARDNLWDSLRDSIGDVKDRFLDQLEKDILDSLLDLSKNLSDLGKNIKVDLTRFHGQIELLH